MDPKNQHDRISTYEAASIITSTMLGAGLLTVAQGADAKNAVAGRMDRINL